jgi:phosphoribosyl 1,2-cyclic phosphodiesterase
MKVWSISSGSSGNCYLVLDGTTLLLLEAGIGVRRLEQEMAHLRLRPCHLSAVLATHEHTDHWQSAAAMARRGSVPLVCSPGSWSSLPAQESAPDHIPVPAGRAVSIGSIHVESFSLPHDAREPVGFLLRGEGATICLATDMGLATDEIVERAWEADLVILEANHDVQMVKRGPYPAFLKARILGDRGHLSNDEAGNAIVRIARGRARDYWLAHLSGTNNTPRVALNSVQSVLKLEGLTGLNVSVAQRDRRSLFWDSDGELKQLRLF